MVEVSDKIQQHKLHQEVGDLLDLGVLGLTYVGIKVSHNNGVLVPESDQVLLQVWEAIQGKGG